MSCSCRWLRRELLQIRCTAIARINAGLPARRALASIRGYLTDPEPELRAAAVQSIRLMQHPDVDGLIAASVSDAESKAVRLSALDAMRNRSFTPGLAQALAERVRSDSDAGVRLAALDLAAGWTNEQPALRTVIAQAASKDSSDMVQHAAQTALAALAAR